MQKHEMTKPMIITSTSQIHHKGRPMKDIGEEELNFPHHGPKQPMHNVFVERLVHDLESTSVYSWHADFMGYMHQEDYIDREIIIKNCFEWMLLMESYKFIFVEMKFKGSVLAWWKHVEEQCVRKDEYRFMGAHEAIVV